MTRHVLVLGATGVAGGAIARHLASDPAAWSVTTVSRRDPELAGATHLPVDLLDADATATAFTSLARITHVVYAAYVERPTMAETVAPNVAMLENALDGLRAAGAGIERVVLIGGGKSYGEHLGPYKTPAKESDPRHLGPIFYNDQEDILRERGGRDGFTWTVLRPDIVIGPSLGSPMNLLTSIAVYAVLCKQEGVPLRFPGSRDAYTALHQITDADLLAEAVAWALTAPSAAGEIFNITNGDLFRWEHLWPRVADLFAMPSAPPQPMSLVAQMAGKEAAWDALVAAHGLRPTPYGRLTSWEFTEAVLTMGFDLVQSTIKIRQAGFHGCRDSEESLLDQLRRLRRERIVP